MPGPESVTLTAMLSRTRRAVIQIRPDGASLGDRLARVVDHVHEHLLDLVGVHFDVGEPGLDFQGGLDLVRHQLVAQQGEGRVQERPNRLPGALSLLAAGEGHRFLTIVAARSASWRITWSGFLEEGGTSPLGEEIAEAHDGGKGLFRSCATRRSVDRSPTFLRLYELFLAAGAGRSGPRTRGRRSPARPWDGGQSSMRSPARISAVSPTARRWRAHGVRPGGWQEAEPRPARIAVTAIWIRSANTRWRGARCRGRHDADPWEIGVDVFSTRAWRRRGAHQAGILERDRA